ncbi:MAG: hypothetical protein HY094_00970 [Candidatus Melainabacteria bacterium]|nr:hypothetical protein [Candidatus Melainabacteria bacterium]
MKRFTDTAKWQDPWFRKLPVEYKNLWQYITDTCDNSGVWKPDFELLSFCIGEHLEYEEALKVLNQDKERIKVLENGNWYIVGFISFQYGELKEQSKPHAHVLSLLKKHNLLEEYAKGIHTLKEKDKDKDIEKDKEEDKDKARGFIKPRIEEIEQYIKEQNYTVDPDAFFNFYESKGWKVGNQPMKDWKAAVRTWVSKDKKKLLANQYGVGIQAINNIDSFKQFHENRKKKNDLMLIEEKINVD